MKLFSKIKAFFSILGEKAEMEVSAAEVKQGRVFLHPVDDPDNTYCIKTTAVDIIINPHSDIREEDILIVPRTNQTKISEDEATVEKTSVKEPNGDISLGVKTEKEAALPDSHSLAPAPQEERKTEEWLSEGTLKPKGYIPPAKRKLTVTLYADEYEMVMERINSSGYHKAEFLLACVSATKKTSWETNYRKFSEDRKQRQAADRQAAKEAKLMTESAVGIVEQ